MSVAAIIAAGGSGTRVGGAVPKQFLDLGDGTIMLRHAIDAVARADVVDEIVVAVPPDAPAGWDRALDAPRGIPIAVATGGRRRQDSVASALARVSPAADLVVIHDAARPFVTAGLVERAVRAAREHGAAVAAVAVRDTVKQTAGGDDRIVRATLPRETIYLAQTPQAFRRDILVRAIAAGGTEPVTDEAMLVERAGFAVHLVEGDPGNVKVTSDRDLAEARARLSASRTGAAGLRVGHGYDLHRLVEGRPLVLAGVRVPHDRGLLGHSDADLVAHAVTDAVLGGAAAGDIGRLFPDTDARWKDADSLGLLEAAAARVRDAGFTILNVDVTVIAERPRLAPHVEAMRANLARALGLDAAAVGIKGKTNEGVGDIGQGDAMACHAVALLSKT